MPRVCDLGVTLGVTSKMQKLTARTVTKIAHPKTVKGAHDVRDKLVPGLSRVVQSSGVQSWCVRYRINGRQRRYTIGRADLIDITRARKLARGLLLKVAEGVDPADEKLALRSGDVKDAFPDLAASFIETHAKLHNRSWIDLARVLGLRTSKLERKHPHLKSQWSVIPDSPAAHWQARPVTTIAKREIVELINETTTARGPGAANKLHSVLSRFFRWLDEQGVIETSPMVGTRQPAPIASRERVLSETEISLVWHAAENMTAPFGAFIRLLLLTGQRRSEVAGIRESEISGEIWTLPAARSKNGREHQVPLGPAAREVIAGIPRDVAGNTAKLLFTTTGRVPISSYSKIKTQLDAEIAKQNGGRHIPRWTLHDIRRSVATGMVALGIQDHVVERVLNHTIRGVAGVYNRHPYFEEKKDALERWELRVQGIHMCW